MPIPQFGPFKQSGSATNTTIQGGVIEGGSSAQQSDDFIELRNESTASLFDTQFSGDVSKLSKLAACLALSKDFKVYLVP